MQNFEKKRKYLTLRSKCPVWVFWGWNWKTILSYLKSAPWILYNCKIWRKRKISKFGTKNTLFGYFWPKLTYLGIFGKQFQIYYCHIWNQHTQIYLIPKFCEKTKIPKFGTKMPDLGNLGLGFEKNIVIFEISSLEFI